MKVVVKMRGGLGNQLFQYAYAKKIAQKYSASKIILDTSYFNNPHIRGLNIDKYILPENVEISSKSNIIFDLVYFAYRLTDILCLRVFGHHRKDSSFLSRFGYYLCEKKITSFRDCTKKRNIYLAGYFQDVDPIKGIVKTLDDDLNIKNVPTEAMNSYLELFKTGNAIGISIRIGDDYAKFGWPLCSREYYENGLKLIVEKTGCKKVFVFSDCIDRVENEGWFSSYKPVYVKNCSSVESLDLLKKCAHFVIANSTFSWWGAFLSRNDKKVIVSPKFFYPNILMYKSDIALDGAIYLDNNSGQIENLLEEK